MDTRVIYNSKYNQSETVSPFPKAFAGGLRNVTDPTIPILPMVPTVSTRPVSQFPSSKSYVNLWNKSIANTSAGLNKTPQELGIPEKSGMPSLRFYQQYGQRSMASREIPTNPQSVGNAAQFRAVLDSFAERYRAQHGDNLQPAANAIQLSESMPVTPNDEVQVSNRLSTMNTLETTAEAAEEPEDLADPIGEGMQAVADAAAIGQQLATSASVASQESQPGVGHQIGAHNTFLSGNQRAANMQLGNVAGKIFGPAGSLLGTAIGAMIPTGPGATLTDASGQDESNNTNDPQVNF